MFSPIPVLPYYLITLLPHYPIIFLSYYPIILLSYYLLRFRKATHSNRKEVGAGGEQ